MDQMFRDGDIVRMTTNGGTLQVIDPRNPDWQRFEWDWPRNPEVVAAEDEQMQD